MTATWKGRDYTFTITDDHIPGRKVGICKLRIVHSGGVLDIEEDDLQSLISAVFSIRFLGYDMSKWEKP